MHIAGWSTYVGMCGTDLGATYNYHNSKYIILDGCISRFVRRVDCDVSDKDRGIRDIDSDRSDLDCDIFYIDRDVFVGCAKRF